MPSNGSFWYGRSTGFPGFLYKRNTGVGARISTKMGPGGVCNNSTDINNKYKPGTGGVGASSTSNRRAKNRLATVCDAQKCFPCYMTLGQYSNYTHNPNGYYPCITLPYYPSITLHLPVVPPSYAGKMGNATANTSIVGMSLIDFSKVDTQSDSSIIPVIYSNDDQGYAYLPFTGMDFFFFGINYGYSDGTYPAKSIYMNTNFAFGFGVGCIESANWPVSFPAILFDFFDTVIIESFVSAPISTLPGVNFVRIVSRSTDYYSYSIYDISVKKEYEIYFIRDDYFQYIQFNCKYEDVIGMQRNNLPFSASMSNITNGTAFQDTFGLFGVNPLDNEGPQTGGSYVIRSDLFGNNWKFFPNTHYF